ncbi:hypothetical protein CLV63_11334 [Murinocardiopsis flavida]|uniref:Uncharacterized protein n=1 Tax=Murinocardiopsis flavida TaxID=645275 RepID=A0A2P8DF74_9ACTN|nr:hypothetical protein [Murinocardiopsis flavida]PSK95871.1 hypothetical protein CLV63_11334 [Murinocardiopsis flavida]
MPQQQTSPRPADEGTGAYERLIGLLDAAGARYRVIDHAPEGRTEIVSGYRGHPVAHAAKCLVSPRPEADIRTDGAPPYLTPNRPSGPAREDPAR